MASSSTSKSSPRASGGRVPPIEFVTLTLRCPVCDTVFTSEIPSPGAPPGRESDLRPGFAGLDPIPSLIQSCPSCRYTAYPQGYEGATEEVDELAVSLWQRPGDRPATRLQMPQEEDLDSLRRWIRRGELVRGIAEGREPFGAERYLLGARCHEYLRDEDPLALADYYVRASWCARSSGQPDLEHECQREAISRMQMALDQSAVPEDEKPRTLYLVGELSRRVGDFAKAVDVFTQLESNPDAAEAEEPETVLFSNLAKRMLTLAVVKSDINALLPEDEIELTREEEDLD